MNKTAAEINPGVILKLPSLIFAMIFVCLLNNWSVIGQNSVQVINDELLSPNQEQFQDVDALAAPWRSSGCSVENREFREPNCHFVNIDEWRSHEVLSLYDEDGTLWYRFSLNERSPEHFWKNTRGFLPLAVSPPSSNDDLRPNAVVLRMVGESSHWYKVEVNEKTRATKYVLKSDPNWAKVNWSYWLYESVQFKIDFQRSKLHDQPNGAVISESADLIMGYVKFLKADSDWAYVEIQTKNKKYYGWLRWRSGRNILVGNIFNNFKIPAVVEGEEAAK